MVQKTTIILLENLLKRSVVKDSNYCQLCTHCGRTKSSIGCGLYVAFIKVNNVLAVKEK